MAKIYTKTGDKGTTGTMQGRMSKGDQLAIALGTIDELNSWIGLCRSELENSKYEILRSKEFLKLKEELRRIQNNLLNIGSGLAGSGKKISAGETTRLEKYIDKLTEELPKLSNFVFPVGYLQVARTIARRAEREVTKLNVDGGELKVEKNVQKYLNRLSDALFTMARWVNFKTGIKEEVWK